jgi:thioredoxin 1
MLHLTDTNFTQNTTSGVVLIDFYADRCGPCQILGKLMPHLADKYEWKAVVAKVNTDTEFVLTQRFGISALPTVIVLKDGVEVERLRWLNQPEVYSEIIDKHL